MARLRLNVVPVIIVLAGAALLFVLDRNGLIPGPARNEAAPKSPPELTVETLASIPDDELEETIVGFIWERKIDKRYNREYEIVKSLPRGLTYLYATWELEAEVNNGGFEQFFFNSSGDFAQEALEGCRFFGSDPHADLVKRAIAIHSREKERTEKAQVEGTKEAFAELYDDSPLTPLDDEFYAMNIDLSALRVKYIREHPEEFVCK